MTITSDPKQLANLFEAGKLHEQAKHLSSVGQNTAAESLFKQAISNMEQAVGADNAKTAVIMVDLATLYSAMNKFAQAEDLLKQAQAITEKAYYADHAQVATVLDAYVHCLYKQGKYTEAEPMAKRALEIDGKTLSGEHRRALEATRILASIYMKLDKYADAETLLTKALKQVDTPLGPACYFQWDLALCAKAQGKHPEAEKLFQLACSGLEQRVRYATAALCLADYANMLKGTGREAEAKKLEDRAKAMHSLGTDQCEAATILPSTLLRA